MTNSDAAFAPISLAEIEAAAARIAPYVKPTPLVAMTPSGLWLKAESLHPTGAFKLRGAFNTILSLSDEQRRHGVIAHSSGNHAQAVAYAARALGVAATVVMPQTVLRAKLEATKRWGAEVILVDVTKIDLAAACGEIAWPRRLTVVEPFDAATIIAATGTIALEILAVKPDVETIVVPVSGGGLIGGISAAVAQAKPSVRVIGAEPALAGDARESFVAGRIVPWTWERTGQTIADGLRVPALGRLPWEHIRRYVRDIAAVSEDDIRAAMRRIAGEARLVTEPSGAVATAAALAGGFNRERTVAVVSGGNVDLDQFARYVAA